MADPFRIRVVGDLHVGSDYGLWPPKFTWGEPERSYPQNRLQRWLWACWEDMIKNYAPPDLLIVNGDLIDGEQRKDAGRNTMSPDIDLQHDAAAAALAPLVRKSKDWVVVKGSPYHETTFAAIAGHENFSGRAPRRWPSGGRVGQVLDFTVRGITLNVAHHPEGGAVLYEGTKMNRTILWSFLAEAAVGLPKARVIIRSHLHFYGLLQVHGKTMVHIPSWQLQTPREVKQAYFKYQPQIGFVDILIHAQDDDPVVIPIRYPIPRKRVMRVA